ncbi:hypothetical protein HWI79_790 [Cryptosporidium felis]|nr:hypothetical protein HWI79_790 [Cryptosporidium felis]
MNENHNSEQALSPSSSEIMKKASRLVDQLLLKTSCDIRNETGITSMKHNCPLNAGITSGENANFESNSVTDSETLSALASTRKNVPSIDIIKRLARRLKNKDSDAISEVNFPSKKEVISGQDTEVDYFRRSNGFRPKSASPTSEHGDKRRNELSQSFADVNQRLTEINRKVECLSSNIDDIQENDDLEDSCNKAQKDNSDRLARGDYINLKDGQDEVENSYLNQLNVAVLQQERLRMWVKDNAKHASIVNDRVETGVGQESEHIPFSDVYYTQQYLRYKTGELSGSGGMLNTSVLSTTVSGVTGQFSYSNDTTVYESKLNEKNFVSEFSNNLRDHIGVENLVNKVSDIATSTLSSYRVPDAFEEPKALRFIRVGDQLRRSITVTPIVEELQKFLSRGTGTGEQLLGGDNGEYRGQFNNKLEKLSNSNIAPNNARSITEEFKNNMVIITVKDNGLNNKASRRGTKIDDTSSTSSAESDGKNYFSCRECSWNPATACTVQ